MSLDELTQEIDQMIELYLLDNNISYKQLCDSDFVDELKNELVNSECVASQISYNLTTEELINIIRFCETYFTNEYGEKNYKFDYVNLTAAYAINQYAYCYVFNDHYNFKDICLNAIKQRDEENGVVDSDADDKVITIKIKVKKTSKKTSN